MNKFNPWVLIVVLLVPCLAKAQTTEPIPFRFEAFANNVRVAPPLVSRSQLGTVRLSGSGEISGNTATGTFTCSDRPQGTISGRIIRGTYSETGNMRQLTLTVQITSPSTPNFPADSMGTLELWDSSDLLPNGETRDGVRLGGWAGTLPNRLRGHDHGFNNADPAAWQQPLPPHSPPRGGPNGGLWAKVEIGAPKKKQQIIELTNENWAEVIGGKELVVVFFTGMGIPKAEEQLAVLTDLAKKYEDVVFAQADLRNCNELFQKEKLRSLPSIGFFTKGESLDLLKGFMAEGAIRKKIEKHQPAKSVGGILGIELQGPSGF